MGKELERLEIKAGSFIDQKGNKVEVEVLELETSRTDLKLKPNNADKNIPNGANAYAKGPSSDYDVWGMVWRFPILYLRKK